jgi:hypothetical protein
MSELLYKGDKSLTSIIVRKTTRQHLREIGHKHETYDAIINQLIAEGAAANNLACHKSTEHVKHLKNMSV